MATNPRTPQLHLGFVPFTDGTTFREITPDGYVEFFNGKLRDELLNLEIFHTLTEAQVLVQRWRHHYNQVRPHSSLGYRPPHCSLPDLAVGF